MVAHWAGTPALAPLASALPGCALAAGFTWGPQSKLEDLAEALTLNVVRGHDGQRRKQKVIERNNQKQHFRPDLRIDPHAAIDPILQRLKTALKMAEGKEELTRKEMTELK